MSQEMLAERGSEEGWWFGEGTIRDEFNVYERCSRI